MRWAGFVALLLEGRNLCNVFLKEIRKTKED
jgi:hypothetical protein